MTRYAIGIRWDAQSTEIPEQIGAWWVDFDDRDGGAGASVAVATKSEAIAVATAWQDQWPDHDLYLPATLAWFMSAPENPNKED